MTMITNAMVAMLLSGLFYGDLANGSQGSAPAGQRTTAPRARFDAGRQIFETDCAACHGLAGEGYDKLGANLVKSRYVEAEPTVLVAIVTSGKQGTVGVMPALGGQPQLSDAEIAAVLTYIRRSWGHAAGSVSVAQVRRTRTAVNHAGPWTDIELSSLMMTAAGSANTATRRR